MILKGRLSVAAPSFLMIALVSILASCAGSPAPKELAIEDLRISALLSNLTLRQRIGQRFIGWVPRDGFTGEAKYLTEAGEIGGFIIYKWNFGSIDEVRSLTRGMQLAAVGSPAGIPLFLAVDQEGGRVAAFRFDEFVQLPAAFYLARNLKPEAVEAASYVNAVQLKSIGINMNLAPVLDLYPIPDETIIGDRSFGPDGETTSAAGMAFVRGSIRGGVLPVVKHFPGHGLSTIDSRVPAVMPAHLLFPAIDPSYPVTLSEIFIQRLLREELGFMGLIVTDGLSMGALSEHYSLDETLLRCFRVGIDVILVHSRYSVAELIDIVVSMVEDGEVTMREIDEGAARVLAAKRRSEILDTRIP